ncbi:MAG: hypothetical protein E7J99_04065 [Clostridium butyricum]|uniref:hypothetical protein n=1 Tax=Clostridium sp. TaxID=1506 RepID=UPI0029017B0B|nr:hypothetical protein [Clostridium sp.]MDU1116409.1 hypothetical protein [Clostridium sp.]MDU7711306.1 hypothetical protein [Clostridium butyricum]
MARPKKHQKINVRVNYPTTEEGKKMLRESQSKAVLDILEKQLGEECLRILMKHLAEKIEHE